MVYFDKFLFEDSQDCFESGMVIYKYNLKGWHSHNVQEVHI